MKDERVFLGHDVGYWLELERQAESLDVVRLVDEIAILRGRVSFYESRLREMQGFMECGNVTESLGDEIVKLRGRLTFYERRYGPAPV